mgnify:CR=1 FL=1
METLLLKVSVLQEFANLFSNIGETKWQMVLMWAVGGLLIYLAIAKQMEPTLLLPMGFGTILVNLPWSGAITQPGAEAGPISVLYNAGIANELFPLLLFIGIGAMIDFGPLLKNPWLMLFGAAAQFGIFFTFLPNCLTLRETPLFWERFTALCWHSTPCSLSVLSSLEINIAEN